MNEQDLSDIANEAERALLGSLILDREAIIAVADKVPTSAFALGRHRVIWDAALRMWERREPIDLLTIQAEVRAAGIGEDRLPAEYFMGLLTAAPTAVHAPFYAERVVQFAKRRAVIAAAQDIILAGYGDEELVETSNLISLLREKVEPYETSRDGVALPLHVGGEERVDAALAAWNGEPDPRLVPTGFRQLDKRLGGGFRRGQVIVLGGRPGMGKTAMMIKMGMASPSLWVSMEMAREEVLDRTIAQIAGVPYDVAHEAIGDVNQRDRWLKAAEALKNYPVSVITRAQTTNQIELDLARRVPEEGTGLVLIDHLDFLADPMPRNATDVEKTARLIRRCKAIAVNCNVAVLVLSHFNRNADHRSDYRPQLSDFKNSGAVEQDADIALLLYRRRYYSQKHMLEDDPEKDYYTGTNLERTELIVAKNRNGESGVEHLAFSGEQMQFYDRYAA